MILDQELNLTLRPMKYPQFYDMYRNAIKNTWTVDEINFAQDLVDLKSKLTSAERHMINRLVAFFATGDSIVSNNLVLNLYKRINSPEARMYLSRQLYEEALHIQFYLTLLDTYIPAPEEREQAFAAIHNIESIRRKAGFCLDWMRVNDKSPEAALLNIICFATCVEGLFFFAAFAYVYFMRSKGLLPGLASGTSWVFRDESMHMGFAFEAVKVIRAEYPWLFTSALARGIETMLIEAVNVEVAFAEDLLSQGISGLSLRDMRQFLEYTADQRLLNLDMSPLFKAKNPFPFMQLQDVQELTNFFERRVSAYSVGIVGTVRFDESF